jgi:hypothetical protein
MDVLPTRSIGHDGSSLRLLDRTWRWPEWCGEHIDEQWPCATVRNTRTIHVTVTFHRLRRSFVIALLDSGRTLPP